MKKLLITGVHGFVGSNLVPYLREDFEIYGLDIVSPSKEGVVRTFSWEDLDAGRIPDVDAVVHLAGKAHDTANRSAADAYFRINILVALAAVFLLFFAESAAAIMILIGCIGFFCSSIFSVIYSQALKNMPDRANEISGLMITGVCGGAAIPPAMGVLTDAVGSQAGSIAVIAACMVYLTCCAFRLKHEFK